MRTIATFFICLALAGCGDQDNVFLSIKRDYYVVSGERMDFEQAMTELEKKAGSSLHLCVDGNVLAENVTAAMERLQKIGFRKISMTAQEDCE